MPVLAFRATLVVLALCGCGFRGKFLLFENTEWKNPQEESISVYVMEEEDLVGDYFDRLQTYQLPSVKDSFRGVLGAAKIPYMMVEHNGSARVRGKTDNFLHVTSDSSAADLNVKIIVESFGYGDQTTMEDTFRKWSWFGALGASLSSDSPQGYLHVSGFARRPGSREVLLSFDGVGLSRVGQARRDAMLEAIENASSSLAQNMLRAKY